MKDSMKNEDNQRVPFLARDRDGSLCKVSAWIDLTNFPLAFPLGASVPRPASIKCGGNCVVPKRTGGSRPDLKSP
jgi:hypothetical protein